MVKIRLKRMGKKRHPFYRLVAADALSPRDGKFIEELGYYNPISKEMNLKEELIVKWLKVGARPTETVKFLLKKSNIGKNDAKSKKA